MCSCFNIFRNIALLWYSEEVRSEVSFVVVFLLVLHNNSRPRGAPVKCGLRNAGKRVKCGMLHAEYSAFYPLHIFRSSRVIDFVGSSVSDQH